MEHGLASRNQLVIFTERLAGVWVAIEVWKVAARDLHPDAVPRSKKVAHYPDGNRKFIYFVGFQHHFAFERFSVARPDDAFGNINSRTIGRHVAKLNRKISVYCRTCGIQNRVYFPGNEEWRLKRRGAVDKNVVTVFDLALILHADHELNASTFASRVAAATLTDLHSTVVAGVATLKGPLHGGANAEVMKLLESIGEDADDERVTTTITDMLGRKQKVPGFGHRVYRTEDPRATHLRQMSRDLGQQGGNSRWFEMSQRIEEVMRTETGINANVDFYSASTYHTLGIAADLFTPIFVVSRVSGWTAHVLEQYANNRLIRPRAEYIGPEYPQSFVPLDERPPAFR